MPTVKITLKKSESTNKVIAVINGSVKVGELKNGKVVPTGHQTLAIKNRIEHLNNTGKWGEVLPAQTTWGGSRENSGRKKTGVKTTTVSFRVKQEQVEQIKKIVKEYLSK